jgi:hypothetical protein
MIKVARTIAKAVIKIRSEITTLCSLKRVNKDS